MGQGGPVLPAENRVSAYRIYVSKDYLNTPTMARMYNDLIKKDVKFCAENLSGSITLHYNQGSLCKITETSVTI